MTRYFWTLFFIGSLIAVAIDLSERREAASAQAHELGEVRTLDSDPFGQPTPKP